MQVKCGYIINTVQIKISCTVIIKIANPNVIKLPYNLTHQVKFFTIVATSSHCNLHVHLIEQLSERQFIPHRWYLTCWITHHYTNLFSSNWTRRWWFQGHLSLGMNKFSWGSTRTGCCIAINTVNNSGGSAKWKGHKMTLFKLNSLIINSEHKATLRNCY